MIRLGCGCMWWAPGSAFCSALHVTLCCPESGDARARLPVLPLRVHFPRFQASARPPTHPPNGVPSMPQCAGWRVAKNAEGVDCITHEWKVRNFRAGLDLFQRCVRACVCIHSEGQSARGTEPTGCVNSGTLRMPAGLPTPLPLSASASSACRIAVIAEEEGHHPDLHLTGFNTVTAEMTTHAAKGLTENDFIVATKVSKP